MFSIRSLIVIILVALLVSLYSRLTAKNKGIRPQHRKQHRKQQQKTTKEIRETVKCAYCDVYLPEKDAIKQRGQYFCSKDHAHKFLQKP